MSRPLGELASPGGFPSSRCLTATSPAASRSVRPEVGVGKGPFVAVPAMGLGSLAGDSRSHYRSSPHVLSLGHRLQVGRPDARRIDTQMVERPLGERSVGLSIGPAVRKHCCRAPAHPSVAVVVMSGRPNPTRPQIGTVKRDGPILIDLSPEPLRLCAGVPDPQLNQGVAMAAEAAVMGGAQCLSIGLAPTTVDRTVSLGSAFRHVTSIRYAGKGYYLE